MANENQPVVTIDKEAYRAAVNRLHRASLAAGSLIVAGLDPEHISELSEVVRAELDAARRAHDQLATVIYAHLR